MTDALLGPMATLMASVYDPSRRSTWQNADKTCHVYLAYLGNVPTFAFEGTTDLAEWMQDFNPVECPDTLAPQIGCVHQASLNNVLAVLPSITAFLDAQGKPACYVTGHSKGAREAPICHALLKAAGYHVTAGYYFEGPRAGGNELRDYLASEIIVATQTWNVHGSDIVTLVPDGPGWSDLRMRTRLEVPDSYGIRDKHVMSGVLAGIAGLRSSPPESRVPTGSWPSG